VLGLRFAGTGCSVTAATLQHFLMHFKVLRGINDVASTASKKSPITSAHALAWRPDRPTLETCLCVTSVALAMVMAGTGDLVALRLFRELRWRVDEGITYGTHMALHMSIGLLFLGGGRASLSRSKEAIAALLVAFFPRFPRSAEDNQYHLQPLRHLWVLAIDWRGLKAIDVETGRDVPVPLQIELNGDIDYVAMGVVDNLLPFQSLRVMAPCLLPSLSDIVSIYVASERYYPATLHISQNRHHALALSRLLVFVKRRPGYLSYMRDPHERLREKVAYRYEGHSHGPTRVLAPWARPLQPRTEMNGPQFPCVGTSDVFASYTDDPLLLTFARQFCDTLGRRTAMELKAQVWGGGVHGGPLSGVPSSMERWCARVLYECVVYDKPVALFLYLQLHHAALTIHWINSLTQTWSIRIALEYYSCKGKLRSLINSFAHLDDEMTLLRYDFIEALRVHMDIALHPAQTEGQSYKSSFFILSPVLAPKLQ